jgi:hypothetical protein
MPVGSRMMSSISIDSRSMNASEARRAGGDRKSFSENSLTQSTDVPLLPHPAASKIASAPRAQWILTGMLTLATVSASTRVSSATSLYWIAV